jgi:hypothetical protein
MAASFACQRRGHRRRVGRWLPDGASTRFAGRVLLDAEARPLLHERVRDGYVLALLEVAEAASRAPEADQLARGLGLLLGLDGHLIEATGASAQVPFPGV